MKKSIFPLLILFAFFVLAPALAADGLTPTAVNAGSNRLVYVDSVYDMALDDPVAAAMSPDGDNLYVVNNLGKSLVAFSRDTTSGALTFLGKHIDDVHAYGLDGANDVVVSPDGNQVYVIGYMDNSLVTFRRHPVSGALFYTRHTSDGAGGVVDGLRNPHGIAINPLGTAVFVASYGEDALAVFTRDSSTGELSFSQVFFDGGGVEGLADATSVAVSPDNKNVYVGGKEDDAVAVFTWDEGFQWLTYTGYVKQGLNSTDGLHGPNHVSLDPTGAHLYVACHGDTVVVFERDIATNYLYYIEHHHDGDLGVDGIDMAQWVSVSPDGRHVYVAGRNDQAVAIFSREQVSGELHYEGMVKSGVDDVTGLAAISSVILSPGSGDHLYAAGRNSSSIVRFDRDTTSGLLTFRKALHNGDGLDGAIGIALSHDGRYAYATGNNDDALTVFDRNLKSGKLSYLQSFEDRWGFLYQDQARSVVVSPDDRFVYLAGFGDDAIIIYQRDAETGELTNIGQIVDGEGDVTLNGPQDLAMSPSGDMLYAATDPGNALIVLDRDIETGALSMMVSLIDGTGPMTNLGGSYAVALSPDGYTVYVAAIDDDAVTIFHWSAGTIDYYGAVVDGQGDVDGLDGANDVVVSPDNRYVYVASREDNAVAYFYVSSAFGHLSYRGMVAYGDGGAIMMSKPRALAISPDGMYLYVVSQNGGSVTVFRRDISTGELTHIGHRHLYETGLFGLETANGIALSPHGRHLYITGYDNDAVNVFRTEFPLFLPFTSR
jgi:6-phosphogluconolactonase (cycloisomerase 2 family)